MQCEIRLDGRDDCRFVSSPVRWDHRVSCVLVKAISKGEQQVEAADALRSFRESTGSLSSLCKVSHCEGARLHHGTCSMISQKTIGPQSIILFSSIFRPLSSILIELSLEAPHSNH